MADNSSTLPVLIAGGGIGGLSTAIALSRSGQNVQVLEQNEGLSEQGAGIQIGPNATRILKQWGLDETLDTVSAEPLALIINDARTGALLNKVPLGATAFRRYEAPYLTVQRKDLQKCLFEEVQNSSEANIVFGFRVNDIRTTDQSVSVIAEDGREKNGRALIGADGIWSSVRNSILKGKSPQPGFAGKTAWRALLPVKDIPKNMDKKSVCLWLAQNGHLVHYPVQKGSALNIVVITNGSEDEKGWSREGKTDELLSRLSDWHAEPLGLLETVSQWKKWSLFELPELKNWSIDRVTLLGDAAHPILPFLAQGGVMAIEDAALLGDLLRQDQDPVESIFRQYEHFRKIRTRQVRAASKRMGRIYHLPGIMQTVRNQIIRARKPGKLLRQFDWLYGFDAIKNSMD